MLMTQEQARKCWCPMVRIAHVRMYEENDMPMIPPFNRLVLTLEDDACAEMASDYEHCRCIASQCAAWRFHELSVDNVEQGGFEVGYCGLAGKP